MYQPSGSFILRHALFIMTSKDNKKQQDMKNGCIGCLGVSVVLVLGMGACGVLFAPKEQTAKEKADEWYSKIADNTCERVLKKQLRDPDSYRANSDFVVSADTGIQKTITWEFRAKNGFGGYDFGYAECVVLKKNSQVFASFKTL